MRKRLIFSVIALVCSLAFVVTALYAWFSAYNASLTVKSGEAQVDILFERQIEEDKWEEYKYFQGNGLSIDFVNGMPDQTYRVTITNKDNKGHYKLQFSFAAMTDYLFNQDLIDYYFNPPESSKDFSELNAEKFDEEGKENPDAVFGISKKYGLYEAFNYSPGHNGNTSRLLYTLHNLQATQGGTEISARDTAFFPLGKESFNLWEVSDGESIFETELTKDETVEIKFTLSYTADSSDYEIYAQETQKKDKYIDKVKTVGAAVGKNITDDQAIDYLKEVTKKETELLLSISEMQFLLTPQFNITQLPREELT